MKKIFQTSLAILALTFVFSACSSTKNTMSSSSAAKVSRGSFVGTWTITNVTYDGLVSNAVQNVFDQAAPNDFIGSTWKLTNSGNGIYTLTNGTSQTIFWSVYNDGGMGTQFQFKKLYEGDKAKNVEEGYRLNISSINDNTMVLKSPVSIGNNTGYVVYSFTKAQ
ncbi:lipocalin family protein [Mucilaginibacter segetis]|uniref:Lipocalin family protein n=1 Tax=Mucilaginibacter segetis TaxID=2793071 RepID=A0A934PSD5_9SPHI|nr:lipocalin family protein [Mucilaginibacter segetis]MBK0378088.1 lipocalin family protein [Mucilaginibacter segetis]